MCKKAKILLIGLLVLLVGVLAFILFNYLVNKDDTETWVDAIHDPNGLFHKLRSDDMLLVSDITNVDSFSIGIRTIDNPDFIATDKSLSDIECVTADIKLLDKDGNRISIDGSDVTVYLRLQSLPEKITYYYVFNKDGEAIPTDIKNNSVAILDEGMKSDIEYTNDPTGYVGFTIHDNDSIIIERCSVDEEIITNTES